MTSGIQSNLIAFLSSWDFLKPSHWWGGFVEEYHSTQIAPWPPIFYSPPCQPAGLLWFPVISGCFCLCFHFSSSSRHWGRRRRSQCAFCVCWRWCQQGGTTLNVFSCTDPLVSATASTPLYVFCLPSILPCVLLDIRLLLTCSYMADWQEIRWFWAFLLGCQCSALTYTRWWREYLQIAASGIGSYKMTILIFFPFLPPFSTRQWASI